MPHTVRELCELAFRRVGLDYRDHVRQDPAFMRPGQPTRLLRRSVAGTPRTLMDRDDEFEDLVAMQMVDAAPG